MAKTPQSCAQSHLRRQRDPERSARPEGGRREAASARASGDPLAVRTRCGTLLHLVHLNLHLHSHLPSTSNLAPGSLLAGWVRPGMEARWTHVERCRTARRLALRTRKRRIVSKRPRRARASWLCPSRVSASWLQRTFPCVSLHAATRTCPWRCAHWSHACHLTRVASPFSCAAAELLGLLAAVVELCELTGTSAPGCEGVMKKSSNCSIVMSVPSSFLRASMSGEGALAGSCARGGTALPDASGRASFATGTGPSRPFLAAPCRRAAGAGVGLACLPSSVQKSDISTNPSPAMVSWCARGALGPAGAASASNSSPGAKSPNSWPIAGGGGGAFMWCPISAMRARMPASPPGISCVCVCVRARAFVLAFVCVPGPQVLQQTVLVQECRYQTNAFPSSSRR
jgi:hypothetical protein